MNISLTIIHTNDLHSEFDNWLRQVTLIRARKKTLHSEATKYLLLDGGDHIDMSTNECIATSGHLNMEMLAELEYHAMAVGNNEMLRSSVETIRELSLASKVPWLLANLRDKDGTQIGGTKESLLIDLGDGIKVGLFGATDQYEDTYERKYGFQNVNTDHAIRFAIDTLKSKGATLIIFLSHLGYEADLDIAASYSGDIDVIVGAHSHSVLPTPVEVAGVIIVQAGALGKYVGELQLTIDNVSGSIVDFQGCLHEINDNIEQDEIQKAILDKGRQQTEQYFSEIISVLEHPLTHGEVLHRIADNLKSYWNAEIGMIFGAATTGGLDAGVVTKGDIFRICKSMIRPAMLEFQGQHIEALINESRNPEVFNQPMYGSGFRPAGIHIGTLFFSGVTWKVEQDETISNITVNGESLDLERWYTFGSVAHLHYTDACGYHSAASSRMVKIDTSVMVKDVFVEYVKQHFVVLAK